MNEKEMEKIADEIKELLKYKNKTYGDNNVIKMGKLGVLNRVEEKIARLRNMIEKNIEDKESKEDSWKDIAGFGIIGVMLERGKWLK
jgi:translation elongation factor EF-Tu-like GTPase